MSTSFRSRSVVMAIVAATLALSSTLLPSWSGDAIASAVQPLTKPHPNVRSSALTVGSNCGAGLESLRLVEDQALHGVALTRSGGWAVGFARERQPGLYTRRGPSVLRDEAGSWKDLSVRSSGQEDGLMAVAARGDTSAWAVGFTTIHGSVRPLAIHWDGRHWRVARPRPPGPLDSMLTDVTIGDDGDAWAVGFRMTADGRRRPLAMRRQDGRWRYLDPVPDRPTSATLTAVGTDRAGGLWAVGHAGHGDAIDPLIYRRSDGRWQRLATPPVAGDGVLTDVVAIDARDAWASGYRQDGGRSLPRVLHWDGQRWARMTEPDFGSDEVVLTAISASGGGDIVVVGMRRVGAGSTHEAVAARWDGRTWSVVAGVDDAQLFDVVADRAGEALAVGRAGRDAVIARACPRRPSTGAIGPGSDTSSQPETAAAGGGPSAAIDEEGPETGLDGPEDDPETRPPVAGPAHVASAGRRLHALRRLPRPRRSTTILARDVASLAGLAGRTSTSGAIVADFDGDGRDDLFVGRDGRPAQLLLQRGGAFEEHAPRVFVGVDRRGCAAADVDGSGLPDLYCAVGGERGAGLKANELWLDPGGPAPREVGSSAGVSDPTGRGRQTAFLRGGPRGTVDLVVTNAPARVDGWPSPSRFFRTSGDGVFTAQRAAGFATRLGALALQAADVDDDGRDELLLVTGGPQAPRAAGTRLYRNGGRGLVDITGGVGIRSFGELDAELVDLDGDRHLDLVQLGTNRLRVSLWRAGRFRVAYERRLRDGQAITSGDADGDGRPDLYVVRAARRGNPPDILLLDRGHGRRYSSMRIPQVRGGDGQDAVAIDHDLNGLTDFLILNGRTGMGPLQLVAFFPR